MSADEDKYPGDSGRRRFVKGVVGGATLAGVGATGSAAINSVTSSSGAGGGAIEAMAIENTAGPAPRGMPQIPVEIDGGELKGVWPEVKEVKEGGRTIKVAETELGGKTYSSAWFQFCGVESYEAVQPDYEPEQGNYFLAPSSATYDWMSDLSEGDRLTVDMFSDYESWGNGIGVDGLGKPANGIWRSLDTENDLLVNVIRSPVIEELAASGSAEGADGETYEVSDSVQTWLQASTAQGFVAWLNKCTHFCCVPKYKGLDGSAKFDAANEVYCPCHQSVYEPFSIVSTLFAARPRPA
ncbi:ubiquinol-cytochrome c reductase iron-sulfur subunit [Halobaculum sp. MBLA0147]|uniref:ubiquinol-cytochrome c reductase iron-sulfur subunit n=1 Tax=Halobaculum sp. MBLA0147 TaxID=3079934 RepID=UPI00352467E4